MGNQQPREIKMGKKLTLKEFEERLKLSFPNSKLEIIEYNGLKEPMEIKCLKCGRIIKESRAEGVFSRINICSSCKEFNTRKEKIKYLESLQDTLEILEIGRKNTKIKCHSCGEVFERTTVGVMSNFNNCPNCNSFYQKQANSLQEAEEYLSKKFPDHNYKVLQYSTFHGNCAIKHEDCKFVYKGRFDSFCNSRGCPKCYRKKSKGEQRIEKWLINHKINYISQYPLSLKTDMKRYKFDFYLPDFNIAIEYNGEQHYIKKKDFFDGLEITQNRDRKKKEYCLENNIELLIIPYTEYDNIAPILSARFND